MEEEINKKSTQEKQWEVILTMQISHWYKYVHVLVFSGVTLLQGARGQGVAGCLID